ncbi:MAG: bifunctional 23S rRNA (guanine(2069)-N(7))-methyltransferase RlmK/23S rRNA (guanine(2445)-N(2))-methyltransferase RlmL [Gammaproteobacteria bacterium]|nr:MAG: bifunctional 23S rRNA (guanine(2069)-N(7))-methyltransferase RlmK/23S rRNA (guanine(2445)-N(2))-methyltransferase RlmL [Gammaproteobacteria bacterium]
MLTEAQARRDAGLGRVPTILGFDTDDAALVHARANAQRAGVDGLIEFQCRPLAGCLSGDGAPPAGGLLAVNPPYGKRSGTEAVVAEVHRDLSDVLRTRPPGWYAAVLTARPEMLAQDVSTSRRTSLYNGPLRCSLLEFAATEKSAPGVSPSRSEEKQQEGGGEYSESQDMLANRLRKNAKRLGRWARREDISCYRLYDADLPEYAVAVDLYQGERVWAQLQEYAPPKTVDPATARRRLREAVATVCQVLEMPMDAVAVKVRRRQRGGGQYAKLSSRAQMMEVQEGGLRFLVNLTDYLDTGLFLHHRLTRQLIRELSHGRHVLNLFGYTGAATVYAAAGGAASTTTVDLSKTYLDWARRNMTLNDYVGEAHEFVQSDCVAWLRETADDARRYDVIFLDPPTFSNSKRMQSTLDTQRDHPMLVRLAMQRLNKDGVLVFTTNRRHFRLEPALQEEFRAQDITRKTTPPDFLRRRPHHCWRFSSA